MKKEELAAELRRRQAQLGRVPAEILAGVSDDELIYSYCRGCGIDIEDIEAVLEKAKSAKEAFDAAIRLNRRKAIEYA